MFSFIERYKYLTIIITLALAILLLGLYFYFFRSAITTIAIPLSPPTSIYFDQIDTETIDYIQNKINTQTDDFQVIDNIDQADIIVSHQAGNNAVEIFHQPLILVSHRQTLIDNINLDSDQYLDKTYLQWEKILVAPEYYSVAITISDPSVITTIDDRTEIINQVTQNPTALAFIPLSQLNIYVHPLSINNISALDDPDLYPVQASIFISSVDQKLTNDFKETIGTLPSPSPITSVLAVGDIMMGRYVGVKIARSGDYTHSFQYVSDYLQQPDITFAQLETPIAPTNLTSEGMILVAAPETVQGLTASGIDLVSLSGNHFGDALRDGMESTFQILDENNIKYIGAGRSEDEAFNYQVIEKNGTKFGFISFVNIMPDSYGAAGDIAGSAWVDFNSDQDLEKVTASIKKTKANCDILIVGFHWGTEYTPHPTTNQIKFAHAAIDAGGDLVVGTHPHVVQADEIYHDKYIIYSLGNFIMDQMWSTETTEGVLMPIYVQNKQIISLDLVPTQIIDYSQVKIIPKSTGADIL
ncbi:MAG: CapA family protein, partial [Patescibacteria group bacterium]